MHLRRPFVPLVAVLLCLGMPLAPLAATKPAIQAQSDIGKVSFVALGKLPRSPESGPVNEYCEGYRAKKLTALGRQVAKLGWIVTSEAPLGPYSVVTFASGFDPGTSALCFARNANIAVFDGTRLIALAFTARSSKLTLGVVESLEGGGLLVLTDPPGFPVGELREENNVVRFTTIALERTFCGARAVVPNVYGKSIFVARKILMMHAWRPERPRHPVDRGWITAQLGTTHIIETESCSGTGVGYCSFNYRSAAGLLSVTTAGDDHSVVAYDVKCGAD